VISTSKHDISDKWGVFVLRSKFSTCYHGLNILSPTVLQGSTRVFNTLPLHRGWFVNPKRDGYL